MERILRYFGELELNLAEHMQKIVKLASNQWEKMLRFSRQKRRKFMYGTYENEKVETLISRETQAD